MLIYLQFYSEKKQQENKYSHWEGNQLLGEIFIFRCCNPHLIMESSTSCNKMPEGESAYSTITGIASYTLRITIPFISSSFNSFDNMRGLMPAISLSSSLKRLAPYSSDAMMGSFHFPETTFSVSFTANTHWEEQLLIFLNCLI